MIVDLEGGSGSGRGHGSQGLLLLVTAAVALLAVPLLVRSVPTSGARSPLPTEAPRPIVDTAVQVGAPSVLAQIAPPARLPPPLQLPSSAAALIDTSVSGLAVGQWPTNGVRLLYRLPDGRQVSLLQRPPDSGMRVLASYGVEDTTVRGHPARLVTSRSVRSGIGRPAVTLWWVEGGAGYELTSRGLTIREVVNLAELLR